jgi:phosphoribosylanthranilate isomerase
VAAVPEAMFRIKICGVTTPRDAEIACAAGADAVGINFFHGSVRRVLPDRAAEIVSAVGGKAVVVGVFVDERPEEIARICRPLGIRTVQLSGREPASDADRVAGCRLKTVHLSGPEGLHPFREYPCEAFLLDADVPGSFGGTGKRLDWKSLGDRIRGPRIRFEGEPADREGRPWILAGGLTPENVLEAVRQARPHGVDVAGGVEEAPGRKDPDKIRRFVENARKGLEHVARQP